MKRSIIGILCAALILMVFAVPAVAADDNNSVITINLQNDQEPQYWQITMTATVVANTGDNLVVSLASPRNIATSETDIVDNLQILPIASDTTFFDSAGNAVTIDAVLPGQEARVTFRYHWLNSTPRMTQMDQCQSVELIGTTKTATSYATADDFARNELVGTVVSINNREMTVYIETGRVYYGNTEYMARGRQRITIPSNATIIDANGGRATLSSLHPYQRVVLHASDYMWAESMPPQLALQETNYIEMLADGEKLLSPTTLAGQNHVTATVLSVSQTETGATYTVQPMDNTRERALAETYTVSAPMIALFDDDLQATLAAIQPGTVVSIHYSGLVYGEGIQARIDWAHSIQIV